MAMPRSSGKRSADPAEARTAFGDHGSALPRVATAPVAPNASADRIIAPMFPGSCTAAITIISGASRAESSAFRRGAAQNIFRAPGRLAEKRGDALRRFRSGDGCK